LDRLVNEAGVVDARFPLGLPTVNNANYLWINMFYSALNEAGRAGFVMANSTGDSRGSERSIRERLIRTGAVDCIIATSPNMFFTVTLPVTLWFLDRAKEQGERAEQVLFVDARHIFQQVARAHRAYSPEQIEFLGNIARMWRGEPVETTAGSGSQMAETFPDGVYQDVPGLCRVVSQVEIAAQDWNLVPGRYVGVAPGQQPDDDKFKERLEGMQEELETLNAEARRLQEVIANNVGQVLAA
jgi:type I restriction enzyme M protein